MRYYYEYKEKNGCKVGGHNLEEIKIIDGYIKLCGVIKRNNILEYKYKVAMNNLLTMAKVMGDPRLIEEFEEKVEREGQRKRT